MVDPLAGEIWMLCRDRGGAICGAVMHLGLGETLVFFTSRCRAVEFLHHLPGSHLEPRKLEREHFLSIVRKSFSPEIATHISWDPEITNVKRGRVHVRTLPILQFLCKAEDDEGQYVGSRSLGIDVKMRP